MKILKPGHLDTQSLIYRGTCSRCKCEVECTDVDVPSTPPNLPEIIKCPTPRCRKPIYLEVVEQ